MKLGELIYSLITIIIIFLIMFSPLIRKIRKSKAGKGDKGKGGSNFLYENKTPFQNANRIIEDQNTFHQVKFSEPRPIKQYKDEYARNGEDAVDRIDNLGRLKKAVIWKEILSPPIALRDSGEDDRY